MIIRLHVAVARVAHPSRKIPKKRAPMGSATTETPTSIAMTSTATIRLYVEAPEKTAHPDRPSQKILRKRAPMESATETLRRLR